MCGVKKMKTRIQYKTYMSNFQVFMFYPNGSWDECKLTFEEALKAYPKSKYTWVEIPWE